MSTNWNLHFGDPDGSKALDEYPPLTDGSTEDNLWTAARANALASSVLEIKKVLRGEGKDLTSEGMAGINAAQLGGHDASYFMEAGTIGDETILAVVAAAGFWYTIGDNFPLAVERGFAIDNAGPTASPGAPYSYAVTWPAGTYTQWVGVHYCCIWVEEGAGGKTVNTDGTHSYALVQGDGDYNGLTNNPVPYVPVDGGGLIVASVRTAPNDGDGSLGLRLSAKGYGLGSGKVHRVHFHVILKGI